MNQLIIQNEEGLYEIPQPISTAELVGVACDAISERYKREGSITSPDECANYLKLQLGTDEREVFSVIFLDNQHRIIVFEKLFLGTIDAASVYPREVVKRCLELNAAAVIFGHNHPSGSPEPSRADIKITERLQAALALIDIRVLDHVVVGGSESVSFAQRGLL